MRHVWVLLIFIVSNNCHSSSGVFSKFSVQGPEYFTDYLLWYEDLVAFDATSFSVAFTEKLSILEDIAILFHFVVLKSSVGCQ